VEPILTSRPERGRAAPLLVWRPDSAVLAISSGPLGGGIGERRWVLNATVPMSYSRNDPDAHLAEIARGLDLDGPGVGLMTGVDVAEVVRVADGGAVVWATVGLGAPIRAAAPEPRGIPAARVGTINIVGYVAVRLSAAALVNAVATVTEAKVQALAELGLDATGTTTDAVCLLCPADGPVEAYGGPRSTWGARLARAAHGAVLAGGAADLESGVPWSERPER
jgi:adenosylcobinamide amidohydrolase